MADQIETTTDFIYGGDQSAFMRDVQSILVQQDDYTGMGGHGLQEHGDHGLHAQVSIRMGETQVNFREHQADE